MWGGFIILEVTGRPTSTFLLFGTTVLGNLAVFGRLGPAQSKQGEKLEMIRSQTNGTLSKRDEKIDRLTQLLLKQHGVKLDDDLNPIIDPEGPQHPGVSGRRRLWVVPDSDL